MRNFSSFSRRPAAPQTAKGAADFLAQHGTMSGIVPVVARLTALKKDCEKILSSIFASCDILNLADGHLILSAPSPALAARLKQQLPQLQDGLRKRGWQVDSIRIKVQIASPLQQPVRPKEIAMSRNALQAFSELGETLSRSKGNTALHEAVTRLLKKHNQTDGR